MKQLKSEIKPVSMKASAGISPVKFKEPKVSIKSPKLKQPKLLEPKISMGSSRRK